MDEILGLNRPDSPTPAAPRQFPSLHQRVVQREPRGPRCNLKGPFPSPRPTNPRSLPMGTSHDCRPASSDRRPQVVPKTEDDAASPHRRRDRPVANAGARRKTSCAISCGRWRPTSAPASRPSLPGDIREAMVREIMDEIYGFGPLEPLLADPTVSDVLVNGPDSVRVERNGLLEGTDVRFADEAHLLRLIHRLVEQAGRRIDERSPMVDAKLPDGSRLTAIIPPLAVRGPTLSLRRCPLNVLRFEELVRRGTLAGEMADFLVAAVRGRLNILISGGSGAGKTTLLNNLGRAIPRKQRIVTIEETAELSLDQPDVVSLETRPAATAATRRGDTARPAQELPAPAAGPHHPGRCARRRGARPAAGDEHRTRRLDEHDPRQRYARRARSDRALGRAVGRGASAAGGPRATSLRPCRS